MERRSGWNESLIVNEKFPALSFDNNPRRIIVVAPRIIITTTLNPSPFSLSNFFGVGGGGGRVERFYFNYARITFDLTCITGRFSLKRITSVARLIPYTLE